MQLSDFMMNTVMKLFTVYEKKGADAPFFYNFFRVAKKLSTKIAKKAK